MRTPVLVVTAYFVDAVETRLKQDFELRRKERGAHFAPDELLSAADGADAMLVTPADRHHPGYLPLKNTFLLPHIGAATIETRTPMGMRALDNIEAVLKGLPPPSLLTSESFGKSTLAMPTQSQCRPGVGLSPRDTRFSIPANISR